MPTEADTAEETTAAPEVTPEAKTPDPAPEAKAEDKGADTSSELARVQAELAKLQDEKKAAERQTMSDKEAADADLAEKKAEIARLDEELEYRKAGLSETATDFLTKFDTMTPAQRAKAMTKILGASQAPTPIRGTGKPINPGSKGTPTKSDEKTAEQKERDRYANSSRMRPSTERKAS